MLVCDLLAWCSVVFCLAWAWAMVVLPLSVVICAYSYDSFVVFCCAFCHCTCVFCCGLGCSQPGTKAHFVAVHRARRKEIVEKFLAELAPEVRQVVAAKIEAECAETGVRYVVRLSNSCIASSCFSCGSPNNCCAAAAAQHEQASKLSLAQLIDLLVDVCVCTFILRASLGSCLSFVYFFVLCVFVLCLFC